MTGASGSRSAGLGPAPPSKTDRIQAVGSVAAAVIAGIAAAFAGWALVVQTEATRIQAEATNDQLALNRELRAEKKAQYANRVSWWYERAPDLSRQLFVQNRSPVPITDVVMRYRAILESSPARDEGPDSDVGSVPIYDGHPVVTISIIPPCTIAVVDQEALEELMVAGEELSEDDGIDQITSVHWDHIHFSDVNGDWTVEVGGRPSEVSPDSKPAGVEGDLWLSEGNVAESQSASDCGVG